MLLPSTIDLRPSPPLPLVSPARPQFAGDRKWLKIAATRLIASRWLQLRLPTRRNLASSSSSSSIDLPPPLTIYEPAYLQVFQTSHLNFEICIFSLSFFFWRDESLLDFEVIDITSLRRRCRVKKPYINNTTSPMEIQWNEFHPAMERSLIGSRRGRKIRGRRIVRMRAKRGEREKKKKKKREGIKKRKGRKIGR